MRLLLRGSGIDIAAAVCLPLPRGQLLTLLPVKHANRRFLPPERCCINPRRYYTYSRNLGQHCTLWPTFSTSRAHAKRALSQDIDPLHEEHQKSSGSVALQTRKCLINEHAWLNTKSLLFVPAMMLYRSFFPVLFMLLLEIPLLLLIRNMTTIWTIRTTMTINKNLVGCHCRPHNDLTCLTTRTMYI